MIAERGHVSGTRRLILVEPEVARPALKLYEYLCLRPQSPLSRLRREMMATVV